MFGIELASDGAYLGGLVNGVIMAAFTFWLLDAFDIRSLEDMRSKSMVGLVIGVAVLITVYVFHIRTTYAGFSSFFFMLAIAYVILLIFFLQSQESGVDKGRNEGVEASKAQLESLFDVGVIKGDKESVFEALPDGARDVKHWKEQQSKSNDEETEQTQETLEGFED